MTRIAVTTTPDAAWSMSAELTRVGLIPVLLPCIRVTPVPDEALSAVRQAAALADWLVITSRRTVAVLWPEGGMPVSPSVAAVGEGTAAAVSRAGGRAVVVGDRGAAKLREHLGDAVSGRRVVFPHAVGADPATRKFLEERGGEVFAAVVYETVPVAPGGDLVDGVVFASPSAVDGWLLARSLSGVVVAAIGGTTAAHLETRGRSPDAVSASADGGALAAAIAAATGNHRLEAL